jgi:hypothetical protein
VYDRSHVQFGRQYHALPCLCEEEWSREKKSVGMKPSGGTSTCAIWPTVILEYPWLVSLRAARRRVNLSDVSELLIFWENLHAQGNCGANWERRGRWTKCTFPAGSCASGERLPLF